MKKLLIAVIPVFVFMFILGSCGSTPIIFDDTLPDNDVAIIHYTGVNIVEYNGISLSWKAPAFGSLEIKIPGGNTEFILNGTVGTANMGYTTYHNMSFKYNFENGKEYTMYINQNLIGIHEGKSTAVKTHIATYRMSSNSGQTLIMSHGKKV